MRLLVAVLSLSLFCAAARAADDPAIAEAKTKPAGVAAPVAESLGEKGIRVTHDGKAYCEIWLLKAVPIAADFKPTLSVKYPFTPGQLVGVLKVEKGADFIDFRGQEVAAGVYTLRYGRQPQDGNHLGTSEVEDFLVAIPAADDTSADPITDIKKLFKMSGKAAGANHPAIFSLLPVEAPPSTTGVVHEETRDLWILETNAAGGADGSTAVPVRLVVIGHAEA
jgi:hypothetical protein